MESHTLRVLSLAPFELARARSHTYIGTLYNRVRTRTRYPSICAAHAGVSNETCSLSHREQLIRTLAVHVQEKAGPGGWSSRPST